MDKLGTLSKSDKLSDFLSEQSERLIKLGENPKTFRRIADSWQRRSTRMEQHRREMRNMIRWRCACLWTLVSFALLVTSNLSQNTALSFSISRYIVWIGFLQLAAIECTMKLLPPFPAAADAPRGVSLVHALFEVCSRGYKHVDLVIWRQEELCTGDDQQKQALNWIKGEFTHECARYRKCIKKWSDIRTVIELTLCGAPCLSVLFTA